MERPSEIILNVLRANSNPTISESRDSFSLDSGIELQLEYVCRKKVRENRVSRIKEHLEVQTQGRQRKQQNRLLYFINLLWPVVLSCLNAYMLLAFGVNSELKGILNVTFVFSGFFLAVLSSLRLAPWQQVIKLYFIVDSIVPILIAAMIGMNALLNFATTNSWYEQTYAVAFPVWVIYNAGMLRVMIAYCNWSKWEVILYKITVLFCALVFFYIGFEYMNGKYKITKGFLVAKENQLKDLMYLYVFGVVELWFQMFRKLSQFDQTDQLRFEYKFADVQEEQKKLIVKSEIKNQEQQALEEELNDLIMINLQKNMKNRRNAFVY